MPWDEVVEHIINKGKGKWDEPDFKEWLLSRGKYGFLFSSKLYRKCWKIHNRINSKNKDYFWLCTGEEGVGKSTILILIGMVISDNLRLKNFVYSLKDLAIEFKEEDKGNNVLIDEAINFLLSRESMSSQNKKSLKLFGQVRQKCLNIMAAIPDYWQVDSKIRSHRARTLIYLSKGEDGRPFARIFGKKALNIINKPENVGKPILSITIPQSMWFDIRWYKWGNEIPKVNDFSWEAYVKLKLEKLDRELDDIIDNEEDRKPANNKLNNDNDGVEYITMTRARKYFPHSSTWYVDKVKKGMIGGKLMGNRWFLNKKDVYNYSDNGNNKGDVSVLGPQADTNLKIPPEEDL